MKLHFHDSVTLRMFPAPPEDVDFQGELFTHSGFDDLSVPFSRVKGVCSGCEMGEQTINVPLPGGSLLPGMLDCRILYLVPDSGYPSGVRRVCGLSRLPVELVRGNGDAVSSILSVNIHQPASVIPAPCPGDCHCDGSMPLSFDEIDNIIENALLP